jgi:transposase-like protein
LRLGRRACNHRNGTYPKTVDTGSERVVLGIPRDRHGHFDPVLIAKWEHRSPGFDDKIIALYARGMSTRDHGEVEMTSKRMAFCQNPAGDPVRQPL